MNNFNWNIGFSLDFNLQNGFSCHADSSKRYLSQMADMYCDTDSVREILSREDPLIYEFYELGCPERAGDLSFGTTILYPGKIGSEYYMTKGHFHTVLDTAEVYYVLSGNGYMVMENPEGDTRELVHSAGEAAYVPRRYAHRTVNTGSEPLVLFFVFAADAGHDYGTIETRGYHKLIVEKNGQKQIVDNPRWKEAV